MATPTPSGGVVSGSGSSSGPDAATLDALKQIMGSGGSAAGGGLVYMGLKKTGAGYVSPYAPSGSTGQRGIVDDMLSVDKAKAQYYDWSKKKQDDLLAQMKVAGMVSANAGEMEAVVQWGQIVDQAAAYSASGHKVSPWDILSRYVSNAGGMDGKWVRQGDFETNSVTGERRYVGPRFRTQTSSTVNLTDPDTAKAIATKVFQDLMGRDPGQGELSQFASALTTAEQNNPVTQTATTEYDSQGNPINTNTQSSGGMTADGRMYLGEQQAKKSKEYGAFQAATTYQNALENLVYGAPK